MANVVGPDCFDSPSTDGLCTWPAKELGGASSTSPNVKFEGEFVEHYPVAENIILSDVPGTPTILNPLGVCQPGQRRLNPVTNTSVHINGKLFAVTGDEASLIGITTPRTLTGPYSYPKILIGTKLPTTTP